MKTKLKGMTAYGRGESQGSFGRLEVEVQGTNRRYLELNLNLPSSFSPFEGEIRKQVGNAVARGHLNLNISFAAVKNQKITIVPNTALAKALKKAYENLAKELKIPFEFCLEHLMGEESILIEEQSADEKKSLFSHLEKAIQKALVSFCEMKEREGEAIYLDLRKRLMFLSTAIQSIEKNAEGTTKKLREKLEKRVAPFFKKTEEDERLMKEIVLYADKADISEEIVRFKALLEEFRKTLEKVIVELDDTKGKRLDFLIQELFREINTMGAKAQEMVITQSVVDVKCELEKMREQVQNVE